MSVRLLYEDRFLLICEKPVGVSSESPGLPDFVAEQFGYRVWPVHRLDQGTGGVIVLARSASSCAAMQEAFQHELVTKEYIAVISGRPETDSGRFEDMLFHDRRSNKTFIVKRSRPSAKKASCEWTLLHSVSLNDQLLSLVRVKLHTGRTHQIRVQFASRGFPLAGDRKYGSRVRADVPALWACGICFPHPLIENRVVSAVSLPPASSFPWNHFPAG